MGTSLYVTWHAGCGVAECRYHESVIIDRDLVNDFNNSLVAILETRSYSMQIGRDKPDDTNTTISGGCLGSLIIE